MAAYEESRNQRLEENKRRMEELGLMNLAHDLKKPKVVRKKAEKRKIELHEARRSSRVAAKPVVVYREQLQRVKGAKEKRSLRRRYLTETARELAIEAAEELVKDIENPVFVKPMLHSHTSSVYWLGVPEDFCKEHMPIADEKFVLVDENEKEWECTYLARKKGLSSGWRGFVVDHDVMDGDCCLFELVKPGRFKVHIVRFEDDSEEDEDDEDEKKPRSRKARKVSRSKKFIVGDDEEDEDDEDEDEDDEDDEEEEEFDSDVCDDHVSEEEEDDDDDDEEEDSEGDYSPKLSEKEVDTLVAAPSRVSRVAKPKAVNEENDDIEDDNDDDAEFNMRPV